MPRRYERCRVCKKLWNVSATIQVNDGAYMCPYCRFKERAKKKKKKEALRCGNSTKPQGDRLSDHLSSSIIQHWEEKSND